ncbi:hypothetical protein [Vibrio ziniensis]|uniref:Uncharacterized protein n=1 Tax=Vibrio ziniensis TaxID=2711221 RepID=A0A6G7CP41_9VIBR|nr:hypothetical protein [Vibrio ziniensis]QIH43850.1 hypothetical protein G5S32_17875 [Vibrio ziniensis]
MAVLPKHTDQNPHYDPNDDLTVDQLHRYTRAANKAQKQREEVERSEDPSIIEVVRRTRFTEHRLAAKSKGGKRSSHQYAMYMVFIAILGLAVMYLTQ